MPRIVTKYFAPWCGHCRNIQPVWDKLKEKYGEKIVEVNCDEGGCDDIRGIPTIRCSTGTDYNGPRTMDGLDKFIAECVTEN